MWEVWGLILTIYVKVKWWKLLFLNYINVCNINDNLCTIIYAIFSRVVFLERRLGVSVFPSLFMWGGISPVRNVLEWQSQSKNYFKNGFSFAGSHLPSRKFIWSEDLLFSFLVSCIDRELFCFSFDLFIFTFFLSLSLFLSVYVCGFFK